VRPAHTFALCAVGRDRPGIMAGVTGVLLRHGVNIEDSQATILRGHFTLMLVIAVPAEVAPEKLEEDLMAAGRGLGLDALLLSPIEAAARAPEPSHIVTVYGADHPGIVHAVTSALAEREVDVTDLQTKLSDELYVLLLEVALPAGLASSEVERVLTEVARDQGVELTVRPLDAEPL
jgi:glycine cleavage system transcriptional repressor